MAGLAGGQAGRQAGRQAGLCCKQVSKGLQRRTLFQDVLGSNPVEFKFCFHHMLDADGCKKWLPHMIVRAKVDYLSRLNHPLTYLTSNRHQLFHTFCLKHTHTDTHIHTHTHTHITNTNTHFHMHTHTYTYTHTHTHTYTHTHTPLKHTHP